MTVSRAKDARAHPFLESFPRGSIYTTIMELGPKRPSPLWFWGPNSIMVVYMDPLGSPFDDIGGSRLGLYCGKRRKATLGIDYWTVALVDEF